MATVIWDFRVKPESATKAKTIIRQIWTDMTGYKGYISHRLLQDDDTAGHFLVISDWTDRATADRIRDDYATAETVKQMEPLLAASRGRTVWHDPE